VASWVGVDLMDLEHLAERVEQRVVLLEGLAADLERLLATVQALQLTEDSAPVAPASEP
jgi:hypothetical protein